MPTVTDYKPDLPVIDTGPYVVVNREGRLVFKYTGPSGRNELSPEQHKNLLKLKKDLTLQVIMDTIDTMKSGYQIL